MKKVGIMTLYYKTYNYGAQLQAYALQKAVEYLGYECEQICYKWYNSHIEQFYSHQKDNTDKFREFAYSIPHSKRIYSPENIHEANEEYDIFITGSDQVWGVVDSMPYYLLPQMALSFADEDKVKFSYAASIGNAALTEDRKAPLKYWLPKLDAISVREQSAVHVISEIAEKTVASVLDPVFLLKPEDWEMIAADPIDNEKYIFVYNILNNPKIDKTAKDLSEKTSLPIKTISYSNGVSAGPREFVGLIRNAEYVISDSFHGTVFSIIFGKQFYTFPIDKIHSEYSRNIRITDLLVKFGLSDRFVQSESKFDLSAVINYEHVRPILEKEVKSSSDFLRHSLAIEKNIDDSVVPHSKCFSCGVCKLICPKKCISMKKDRLGFSYPVIDNEKCIKCNLCRTRCPAILKEQSVENLNICYAAINKNEQVRKDSSSGGAFSAFAHYVLDNDGVVFGARYDDNFDVVHDYAETLEDVKKFMHSKYSQSDLKNTFRETEEFLKKGRIVLFTGCGCQINALKTYLEKEYDNLYTVDLVCIGVTSPSCRRMYIEELKKDYGKIVDLNERTKKLGFVSPPQTPNFISCTTQFNTQNAEIIYPAKYDLYKNTRYNWFKDICMHCPVRNKNHLSDISIGDLYGELAPQYDNGNGNSLVIARSHRGLNLIKYCKSYLDITEIEYEVVRNSNGRIETDILPPLWRNYIQAVAENLTFRSVYYENHLCQSEYSTDKTNRLLWIEHTRSSLYTKFLKYQMYNCLIDDEPFLTKNVIIYGAGKIGKMIADCSQNIVKCFADRSEQIKSCAGYPVYRFGSLELETVVKKNPDITFIITPVWDYEDIMYSIKDAYPDANILTAEKLVEKIWE